MVWHIECAEYGVEIDLSRQNWATMDGACESVTVEVYSAAGMIYFLSNALDRWLPHCFPARHSCCAYHYRYTKISASRGNMCKHARCPPRSSLNLLLFLNISSFASVAFCG